MPISKRILTIFMLIVIMSGNLIGKSKESIVLQFNPKADATRIIELCNKYENEFDLKENTLLALIAVESSFKNVDNGRSLGYVQMQMPTLLDMNKIYKINKVTSVKQFKNSMENQIYYAGLHLKYLKNKVKSEKGAFLAYNVGLGAYYKGKYNIKYYNKIIKNRNLFNSGTITKQNSYKTKDIKIKKEESKDSSSSPISIDINPIKNLTK